MKTLHIGIAGYDAVKRRTLAIARGEYKPRRNEPKIWFPSAESAAKILSDRNRALLAIIATTSPESISVLAEKTGRQKSNLSRTLKTMEHYGLVSLKKARKGRLVPRVPYRVISLTVPIQPIA